MESTIEDFVPYDESILWKVHDGYFAQRGSAAWKAGDIPYAATSSYPMARQHARLVVALVDELARTKKLSASAPVQVLDVGAGLGEFARNFLRALERGTGEAGRNVSKRLRYILSDYSETTVRDALAAPELARAAEEGRLVPATFDLARPGELRDLSGKPVEGKLVGALSNYICCVTRPKILRKSESGFSEMKVRVWIEAAVPVDAGMVLEDPTRPDLMKSLSVHVRWDETDANALLGEDHAAALADAVATLPEATVTYPRTFLELVRGLAPRMVPGGLLLVNDYGHLEKDDLAGLQDRTPSFYGNTLNNAVDFPVLEAFAKRAGHAVLLTRQPLLSVHSAAIFYAPAVAPALVKAFKKTHDRSSPAGQKFMDLAQAAKQLVVNGQHVYAARIFQECLALEPGSFDVLLDLGKACIDAGRPALALRYLRRGRKLDVAKTRDFDFMLGRAYFLLKKFDRALAAFTRAHRREERAATHAQIGSTLECLGRLDEAMACYRKSLALESESELAKVLMRRVLEHQFPELKKP